MYYIQLVNKIRDDLCWKAFTTMQTRGVIISASQMVTKIRCWYDVPRGRRTHEGAGREQAKRWSWVTRLPWPWRLCLTVTTANPELPGFPLLMDGTSSFLSSFSSPAFALTVAFCQAVPGSCLSRKCLLLVSSTKEIFSILSCRCCFNAHLTVVSLL